MGAWDVKNRTAPLAAKFDRQLAGRLSDGTASMADLQAAQMYLQATANARPQYPASHLDVRRWQTQAQDAERLYREVHRAVQHQAPK